MGDVVVLLLAFWGKLEDVADVVADEQGASWTWCW